MAPQFKNNCDLWVDEPRKMTSTELVGGQGHVIYQTRCPLHTERSLTWKTKTRGTISEETEGM